MHKFLGFLNTPFQVVIAVASIILMTETLIMLVIENLIEPYLHAMFQPLMSVVNAVLLTAIVSPALYILIFRNLRRMEEYREEIAELSLYKRLSVGRELRMKNLKEENAYLHNRIDALRNGEPASVESIEKNRMRLEAALRALTELLNRLERQEIGHDEAFNEIAENRNALLSMLDDLEEGRKKLEEVHREWMMALDHINDPIFLHDGEFRILRANQAYRILAGIKFRDFIGRPYYEVFPKLDAPLPGCRRAMEKGGTEEEILQLNGDVYRSRAVAIHDENNRYIFSVHTLENITVRKSAETERNRLSEALRQTAEAICIVDPSSRFSFVNPAFERLFGYSADELIGQAISKQSLLDIAPGKTEEQILERILKKGGITGEMVRTAKDGTELPFQFTVAPIYDDHKSIDGYIVTMTDLRPIKDAQKKLAESEAQHLLLLESLIQRIYYKDRNSVYITCNSAYARDIGITRDEIRGRTDYDLFPEHLADIYRADDRRLMEKGLTENLEEPYILNGKSLIIHTVKTPVKNEKGVVIGILGIFWDVTDVRKAQKALHESEKRYRSTIEMMMEGCQIIGNDWRYIMVNEAAARHGKKAREDLLGRTMMESYPGIESSELYASLQTCMERRIPQSLENEFTYPDGSRGWFDLRIQPVPEGIFILSIDISKRKEAEMKLLESEERFRKISSSAQDAIIMMGPNKRISFWNAAAERIFGYTVEEAMGEDVHRLIAPAGDQMAFEGSYPRFRESGQGNIVGTVRELTALRKGGETFPIALSVAATQIGGEWNAIGIVRDITERRRAEQSLRESEEKYRSLFENMSEGFAYCQMLYRDGVPDDFVYLMVNDNFYRLTGLKEVIGKRVSEVIPGIHESNPELLDIYGGVALTGKAEWFETYVEVMGIWFSVSVYSPQKEYFVAVFENITERKQAEISLRHLNRGLNALSAVNRALVHSTAEKPLLREICNAIVEDGYRVAWVGYTIGEEKKLLSVMAHSGDDNGYLETLPEALGRGAAEILPYQQILSDGGVRICQSTPADPKELLPWQKRLSEFGFTSSVALPLQQNGEVFGLLSIHADAAGAFTDREIALMGEMAEDVSFGVKMLRMKTERDSALNQGQEYLEQLRHNLEEAVQAIATTVELRDPYTAGHQRRVAELATAIAEEIGLPPDQVHGIHLAGIVHDLGKIHIPAEVLSKPGRLNEIEYSFIKIHPQAGYEILKDIEFPWPIAQVVLQHHELLNGSGYPQGLKENEILLESRILTVADVVEAMSSHRPYRPGLGVEAALEEILAYRGILYDAQAVDACLVLFREKHFVFSN